MRYLPFSLAILFCVFLSCGHSHPLYYPKPNMTNTTEIESDEEYDKIIENEFYSVAEAPLSTFSIDVDGASYSNIRRMINDGKLPPADAVRIEEMINYFDYSYPEPQFDETFKITTEVAPAPWNNQHQLIQIGIKGKELKLKSLPSSNLVFLLDVSGSMQSYDKLPLLKKGFQLLVDQLRDKDKVAIVVYAGDSGVVLEPTPGSEKSKILDAINSLEAGGSTAGAQGIQRAYELAKDMYKKGANNRVILATDGDFNVGIRQDDKLIEFIEEKRESDIFLSVLGFGTGNLKDSKMEKIANYGNGNYYYIDSILEAKKVMVSELGGTIFTIAKDVKIQVEFNPLNIESYRLIGYENRILEARDFNDDSKDAGELGAGHTVTALYEIVPAGVGIGVDPLRYQTRVTSTNSYSDELLTLKLRYKQPDGDQSSLVSNVIKTNDIQSALSSELSFAASVAGFGMLLRDSEFKGDTDFSMIIRLGKKGLTNDENGYRSEYLRIVEHAELLYPISQ